MISKKKQISKLFTIRFFKSCLTDFVDIYKRANVEIENNLQNQQEFEKQFVRETIETFVRKLAALSKECHY